jgi:hypothetical protein
MTLHAPAHQAGTVEHHWLRDVLIVGVAIVLAIGAVWGVSVIRPADTTPAISEGSSLVLFRAAERDAWTGPVASEEDSLIQFRAGERELP